ncbi:MAG: hypothetical protein KGL39_53395, partial [Patescibacteria group bacterium]|nr:hypothetical protein [Patescibacteria group bacterium]
WQGWKYQSWYLGNPHFVAGNFFANFREDVHSFPNSHVNPGDREIIRWFGSMDYGAAMPNCFHLHGEDSYGDCYTFEEVHTMGLTIAENSAEIKDAIALHNLMPGDLEFVAVGHDVLKTDRQSNKDGSTVFTEYGENGIELTAVKVDRASAWSQMLERLGNPDKGIRPTWYIHKKCHHLLEQVKTAQVDEKKPDDIVKQNADRETGDGGSDALEGARNGLVLAYSGGLENARAIQMGSFQSAYQQPKEQEYIDVDAEILECERLDREKRGIFV